MDEASIGYELEMVPNKSAEDKKTGITIKGKDVEYLEAHRILKDFFLTRGQKYIINGTEIRIVDLPKNKLIKVEVKNKGGMSGKVNLNIYEVNTRGGATIMIQKVSGGGFEHVKIFGLKVIKFLIDGLINGNIQEENIHNYKIKTEKTGKKEDRNFIEQKVNCGECERKFKSDQGLKKHMTRFHSREGEDVCDSCEKSFDSDKDLAKHNELIHGEILSPIAKKHKLSQEEMEIEVVEHIDVTLEELENISWEEKRFKHRFIETKVSEEELEQMQEYDEQERKIKVNEIDKTVEELNDEKVILKQQAWFEEEVRYQEMKKQYSEKKEKEVISRKRQRSKKKSKSKKREKVEETVDDKNSTNVNEIPKDLEKAFKEVGLNLNEYRIYKVKGDGACASNCVAVHIHGEEKLGQYVKRNMNEYEAEFFPFFRQFYSWPHTEKVGSKDVTFETEKEYIDFLKNDSSSGFLWMDHQGLQIVSNAYQMKIHILTVGLGGMSQSRWTHLVPDQRLESFNKKDKNIMVDDLWLLHQDDVHFDIMIKKDSVLAKGGLFFDGSENSCEKCKVQCQTDQELKEHIEKVHVSCTNNICKICEKNYKTERDLKVHLKRCHSKNQDDGEQQNESHGPGYMGWALPDEEHEITERSKKLKAMEEKITELEIEKRETRKEMNMMKREINSLKEDYKKCMEALMKETHDKNKAEILCKVLREKIETEKQVSELNDDKERKVEAEKSESDMSVDEDEWKEQRHSGKKKHPRNKRKKCDSGSESEKELKEHKTTSHEKCSDCNDNFETMAELNNHIEKCHKKKDSFNCEKCKVQYQTVEKLREHIQNVHNNRNTYSCQKCEEKFKTVAELKVHMITHTNEKKGAKFPCQKCNKIYSTMSKLRRHDWRSHREVMCNRCGENIASRQDLKEHREVEHEIAYKVYCRYYPNCSDDDECLYVHGKTEEPAANVCADGSQCRDQSCRFSDKEHKDVIILCKFQKNCNRLNCAFKHIVDRRAFLESGSAKESLK